VARSVVRVATVTYSTGGTEPSGFLQRSVNTVANPTRWANGETAPCTTSEVVLVRRFFTLAALSAFLLVLSAVPAVAKPGDYTCSDDGPIPAGTYSGLIVAANCWFGGDVTVNGSVTVMKGAVLNDHAGSNANHVLITGNVKVGKGAILGLGTYNPFATHDTIVNGSVVADQPLSLYLSFATVHGNVVSNGGGTAADFRNFPIKDNTIDGNLIVQGWRGGWLGVIRNEVGGNVIVSKNASVVVLTGCTGEGDDEVCTGFGPGFDDDSTEVQTNAIGGNLICQGNFPAAQVNELDGGVLNEVAGNAIGQCSDLTE
jgi:hypothetical protein